MTGAFRLTIRTGSTAGAFVVTRIRSTSACSSPVVFASDTRASNPVSRPKGSRQHRRAQWIPSPRRTHSPAPSDLFIKVKTRPPMRSATGQRCRGADRIGEQQERCVEARAVQRRNREQQSQDRTGTGSPEGPRSYTEDQRGAKSRLSPGAFSRSVTAEKPSATMGRISLSERRGTRRGKTEQPHEEHGCEATVMVRIRDPSSAYGRQRRNHRERDGYAKKDWQPHSAQTADRTMQTQMAARAGCTGSGW